MEEQDLERPNICTKDLEAPPADKLFDQLEEQYDLRQSYDVALNERIPSMFDAEIDHVVNLSNLPWYKS